MLGIGVLKNKQPNSLKINKAVLKHFPNERTTLGSLPQWTLGMHVALLALLLQLATALCTFQAFLSSARLGPEIYSLLKARSRHHWKDNSGKSAPTNCRNGSPIPIKRTWNLVEPNNLSQQCEGKVYWHNTCPYKARVTWSLVTLFCR